MIVYYLNNQQPYLKMAANSIKMLRQYNAKIPIILFYVTDSINKNFAEFCKKYNVEILQRPKITFDGDDNFYFPLHKVYLKELSGNNILFLDVDTFIFDDVQMVIDKYKSFEFVACKNRWMNNWHDDYTYGVTPFNSGIMLFNSEFNKVCFERLPELSKELRESQLNVGKWLKDTNNLWTRDEFAITLAVARERPKFTYFDDDDCYNVFSPHDINQITTKIFHSYSRQWKQVYDKYVRDKHQKKIKCLIF